MRRLALLLLALAATAYEDPDGFVVAGVVAAPIVLDGDAFVFTWRLAQAWVGCGAAGVVHASVPSFAGA